MKRQLLPQGSATYLTTVDYEPLRKTAAILIRSAVSAYNSLSRLSLVTADASTEGVRKLTVSSSEIRPPPSHLYSILSKLFMLKVHGLEETS